MNCAVFFNLDDTLTELDRGFDEIFEEAVAEAGIDDLADRYPQFKKRFFKHFGSRAFPRRQAIEDVMRDDEMYDADMVERFADAWEEAEADAVRLKDGAKAVLEDLSDEYVLGILTNGTGKLQRQKLKRLGIAGLFDVVIVSGEEGVGKPSELFFEKAKQSVEAERYVIVSHLPKRDIVAGKKAGFHPVWVTGTDKDVPEDLARTIDSFDQLPAVLQELSE